MLGLNDAMTPTGNGKHGALVCIHRAMELEIYV